MKTTTFVFLILLNLAFEVHPLKIEFTQKNRVNRLNHFKKSARERRLGILDKIVKFLTPDKVDELKMELSDIDALQARYEKQKREFLTRKEIRLDDIQNQLDSIEGSLNDYENNSKAGTQNIIKTVVEISKKINHKLK